MCNHTSIATLLQLHLSVLPPCKKCIVWIDHFDNFLIACKKTRYKKNLNSKYSEKLTIFRFWIKMWILCRKTNPKLKPLLTTCTITINIIFSCLTWRKNKTSKKLLWHFWVNRFFYTTHRNTSSLVLLFNVKLLL